MRKPFNNDFPITQIFGNKLIINGVEIYAQWGYKGHNGIDYGTPSGTPILAPHSGKVIEASFDANGYGNYVKIENDKEGSVLAHFSKIEASVGQEVKEGQRIALSGNTGNSTGPHLHWGYYRHPRNRQNGYGGFIDQTPYLTVSPDTMQIEKAEFERLITKLDTQDKKIQELISYKTEREVYVKKLETAVNDKDRLIKELQAGCQKQVDEAVAKYREKVKRDVNSLLSSI